VRDLWRRVQGFQRVELPGMGEWWARDRPPRFSRDAVSCFRHSLRCPSCGYWWCFWLRWTVDPHERVAKQ